MPKQPHRLAAVLLLAILPAAASSRVALVADGRLDAPAKHGLTKLRESLAAKGHELTADKADFYILAGLANGSQAARALMAANSPLPASAEALAVRRSVHLGKPALILCGSDARGLMYAALDAADRIAGPANPFSRISEVSESPYIGERGISMYTMQRALFESRLFDENHWRRYFDLLARSRINTFTIIFGYENGGFMAPLYPYFFDVPAHSEVRLVGGSRAEQERRAAALRSLIRLAHERGIDVIPAVWDHIYRGGVQGGGIPGASELVGKEVPGLVSGLTAENLAAYTKAALRRFFEQFPDIDGIEFRMHNESGLKREEMPRFWNEVFAIIAKAKPGLRVTLRAKELPDSIIDDALAQGLEARVETKYWMEQMGLPFHPTHINRQNQAERRHGYADLLTYPQRYRVHWRLWNGGTTRILLWADPEYVRRFAASARLYDGNSIDVNEMLATWMLGEPHPKPPMPLLNPNHRWFDYEFERYWHFYQVWGRVSYNPQTPSEVWEREFQNRFGGAGLSVMRGLHEASGVLPRIVASAYRYQLFPTTRGWAEMMRQEDLPKFADLEGTDLEQFMSPRDAARSIVSGTPTSLRTPEETSRWFASASDRILKHVSAAEAAGVRGKEALTTLADLRILAGLARYYAARLPAAVDYNLYRETGDLAAFDASIAGERRAAQAWSEIVEAAGDVYSPDLALGVHAVGFPRHWREELGRLRKGLAELESQRAQTQPGRPATTYKRGARGADRLPPSVEFMPAGPARPGQDLRVSVRAHDPSGIARLRLRYRHLTQVEDYLTAEMVPDPATSLYTASIPGRFLDAKWDVMYFVEAIDQSGNGRNYPDLDLGLPYVIVPVQREGRGAPPPKR